MDKVDVLKGRYKKHLVHARSTMTTSKTKVHYFTRKTHVIPGSMGGCIKLFLLVKHFSVSIKIVHVHYHLASEEPPAGRV